MVAAAAAAAAAVVLVVTAIVVAAAPAAAAPLKATPSLAVAVTRPMRELTRKTERTPAHDSAPHEWWAVCAYHDSVANRTMLLLPGSRAR